MPDTAEEFPTYPFHHSVNLQIPGFLSLHESSNVARTNMSSDAPQTLPLGHDWIGNKM